MRFGAYFFENGKRAQALDEAIDTHYDQVRAAVAGERDEPS